MGAQRFNFICTFSQNKFLCSKFCIFGKKNLGQKKFTGNFSTANNLGWTISFFPLPRDDLLPWPPVDVDGSQRWHSINIININDEYLTSLVSSGVVGKKSRRSCKFLTPEVTGAQNVYFARKFFQNGVFQPKIFAFLVNGSVIFSQGHNVLTISVPIVLYLCS